MAPIDVTLDPPAIQVQADGVPDYYWPVRQDEVMRAAAALVDCWVDTLRHALAAGNPDARLINIVGAPLFTDILGIAIARLLATRFVRDGRRPTLSKVHAAEWRAAFLGEPLSDVRLRKVLEKGVMRPPFWRRWIRPLVDWFSRDIYIRRPLAAANLERDTIAVTICPLIRAHADEAVGKLVYVPLYEWFYPPTPKELRANPPRPVAPEFRDHVVGRLEDVFRSLGAEPVAMPTNTLPRILDAATAWVRFYLERIEARPEYLPRQLWKGSSGVIWSRILADAVQANGGHVTGHDHALGANYSERTLIPFNELQANNVFITFSETQAALYRRLAPRLLIAPIIPDIRTVAITGYSDAVSEGRPAPVRPPQTVLYVTPYLSGSRIGAMPLMPAIMAFDWQARLFTMLQAMGLKVTQKPHPESEFPTAEFFFKGLGVPARTERFEQIVNEFDIVLFDFSPQSCFGSALNSNRPIVLIDFGITEYSPDLRAKLERRVAVLKGWFDDQNRAQVNPNDLFDAVHRASSLRDPAFVKAISR